ncbi:MAG: hypothetical protein AOA65_1238 [Candidatus Bathyarchaeota archaeon BA1]|nr:MAG: hypothetical protein AOA65_1238 [Candidatus Bathyarchaeota archaeon BA1]
MTKLAMAIERALQSLHEALDDARKRGEEEEEFFRRTAEACMSLAGALEAMRVYGKIDPETYMKIRKNLLGEIVKTE